MGFACHSIFGLAYRLWPAMKASALAPIQFWLFVLATPVMLIGLYFTLSGGTPIPTIIGSIGVCLGAALFARHRLAGVGCGMNPSPIGRGAGVKGPTQANKAPLLCWRDLRWNLAQVMARNATQCRTRPASRNVSEDIAAMRTYYRRAAVNGGEVFYREAPRSPGRARLHRTRAPTRFQEWMMKSIFWPVVAISLAVGGAADPTAAQDMPSQGFSLYGAWSGELQTPKGVIAMTKSYRPDGAYVSVGRLSNGAAQRFFGSYRATMTGQNELVVQNQPRARQPSAMCARMQSRNLINCVPIRLPPAATERIRVVSPTEIQVESSAPGQAPVSVTLYRDPHPALLSMNIPERQVTDMWAAPMPQAPTITPYDQSGVHKGMNDFIYGHMRGCQYKDTGDNGTITRVATGNRRVAQKERPRSRRERGAGRGPASIERQAEAPPRFARDRNRGRRQTSVL